MRDLFLLNPEIVFLNHGSFGACPRVVFDRYQQWQRDLEWQPVEFLGRRYDGLIRDARNALAAYVGSDPENLLYVTNATAGLNMVARSLHLQPGDEILTTDHEYGALELTWQYVCRETGAKVVHRKVPMPLLDAEEFAEAIWQGVTSRTKVIFLSHITSPTALIFPVELLIERARAAGILTMIDGAHVPGHLPLSLDALGADFYSGNNHKWLCAPKGSALLHIRPEHHDRIDPLVISWGWDGQTLFDRTRWQGTQDVASYLATPDAIQFQQEHHWERVRARCHDLAIETMERICGLTGLAPIAAPQFFGQMVAVPLPDCDEFVLKQRLYDEHRVEVPLTRHDGKLHVRVSIQGYNTREEVDVLIDALRKLVIDGARAS